ncbi:diaminopimelate decarboxylase [Kushneria phosphatilytica]|uniref:Diaminopimelate decarboxylase n=1 Tax=Kushneria phosphatilytica TaxID=657387 RepID=A0A1S1NR42_9GAMM|nr:diaminopimelate decarboxylase [Kushneria phosphatilytica]OHV08377.1 diaminopimelate decarboxylase [Kushneria phosphatilytica]QEL09800.1 diaminopimelate decarboxylase [Kushneria phosphatilytica]
MTSPHFVYRQGELYAEDAPLTRVAAQVGTPCYVYSKAAFTEHYRAYAQALAGGPHLVCYALKANSNLAVLGLLASLGAGFDIVSVGELERVLAVGGDPGRIVFSGVGKREDEMRRALAVDIKCFNVESEAELEQLARTARSMGRTARVSLRVNPDVDAGTHPYISTGLKENKFGIAIADAERVYHYARELAGVEPIGIDCHIGSQLTELSPFMDALDRLLELHDRLAAAGIVIRHLDLGGGLGVDYQGETPPSPGEYIAALRQRIGERPLELILEPGRSIAANAGLMLTRVMYLKPGEHRSFAIVDGAMNDLIRPSLYQAWQRITAVCERHDVETHRWEIVGPVCESGDYLGHDRPLAIAAGDLLAVHSAGAYGFVMASNYNTRPRPPEVMIDGSEIHVVRQRERLDALWAGESLLPGATPA